MRFGVLGALEVRTEHGPRSGTTLAVPGVRARALLAHLLVEPGRPVPADRLVDLLWGDDPPRDPRNTLQTRVWALRRVLDDIEPGARSLVALDAGGYRLTAPDAVDAVRFRRLVEAARVATAAGERRDTLVVALGLWRGPAFADVRGSAGRGEARLEGAAAALEEERLIASEELAEARLALGEHAAVAADLTAEVDGNPLRERLRTLHLRALAGAGRQGDALAAYRDVRARLAEELGVDPGPELRALHEALLAQDPALLAPRRGDAVVEGLVGRDVEITAVVEHLATGRLVTITGPGGVGKTRLAVAATGSARDPRAETQWVELAGAGAGTGAAQLATLAARALGLRDEGPVPGDKVEPVASLVAGLRGRAVLLVLDNGEHVVDGLAVLVGAVLREAPRVRILVTSQEPLAVADEVVVPLGPLALPAPGAPDEEVLAAPAVRLFLERARAAGGRIDAAETAVVAGICRRLDGLPLALELAAARVRGLGVGGVAAGTADRFRVLGRGRRDAPTRHRTLQATFDWAWALLGAGERTVLCRLSVVAGTIEAATVTALGPVDGEVLDVLARLVERSWVVLVDGAQGPRYRLLESVAAYAAGRLAESGEEAAVRGRHADHFLGLVDTLAPELHGPRAPDAVARLAAVTDDLARAHRVLVARPDAAPAQRLAETLAWPSFLSGRHREALAMLRATPGDGTARREWEAVFGLLVQEVHPADLTDLTDPSDANGPSTPGADPRVTRADARRAAVLADVLAHLGDPPRVRAALSRADARARAAGDAWSVAVVDTARAVTALLGGDLAGAERHVERARGVLDRLGERWAIARATGLAAQLAQIRGDLAVADARHESALAVARSLDLWPEVASQLSGRGRVALLRGDLDGADAWHLEAREVAGRRGDRAGQEHADIGLGLAARRRGDLDAAERRFAAWTDWNRDLGADHGTSLLASQLGFVAEQRGDHVLARRHHEAALAAAGRAGDPRARALALEGLAGAAALAGEHVDARRLLDEADVLRRELGAPLPAGERDEVDRIEARLAAGRLNVPR